MSDKVTDHPFEFLVTAYTFGNQGYLVHKVGNMVDGAAVQWNTRTEEKEIVHEGVKYMATLEVINSDPYITLIFIPNADTTPYILEDSPMDGGASTEYARRIGEELIMAADYCEWLKSKS